MAGPFLQSPFLSTTHLGVALRRWRLLHRVKQQHAAQLFNVAQSTISRWESGAQAMEPAEQARLEQLLAARLQPGADQALARLVNDSPRPVHLVCDLTHRLLACSPARAAQFSVPVSELLGESLWGFSTAEIVSQEAALDDLGWRSMLAPPSLEFVSGANDSAIVPIRQSLCRWTRLTLSDGTAARLVETL
ncbi:helix-turn-helix domain-containing protein [Pseudomonas sp. 22526]|uniref:helix-turn-helix domain-containing protein n=1 Tax=Pseudomonas sp. 22526 TaxID=3453937 RepID=UPI003F8794BA